MGRIASTTTSQLRRQFLLESAASRFAPATSFGELAAQVVNGAVAVETLAREVAHDKEGFDAADEALDAKIDANKALADSADAALLSAIGAISVPGDPEMEAAALRVLDAALPVLAVPLAPIEVVVDHVTGAKKRMTFGPRGQVVLIEKVVP